MSDQQIISLYMHVFPHCGIILDHIDYDLNRQLPLYVRYVLVYNMFQAPMLLRDRRGHDRILVRLKTMPMQSVSITTDVSSNLDQGEMCNIM